MSFFFLRCNIDQPFQLHFLAILKLPLPVLFPLLVVPKELFQNNEGFENCSAKVLCICLQNLLQFLFNADDKSFVQFTMSPVF